MFAELGSFVELVSSKDPDSSVELVPSVEPVSLSESSKPMYTIVEANSCLKITWRISTGTVISVLAMFFEFFEAIDATKLDRR